MTERHYGIAALAAGLAILGLAGCTPPTQNWSAAQSAKRNVVNWVEYHHDIAFAARSADVAPDENAALTAFLDRNGKGEGVRLFVAAAESADPALALRREAAIAALLRRRGLRVDLAQALPAAAGQRVRVTVGRHVVTIPGCPDWTKAPGDDPGNTVSSNFGCATTANLGLMIADPGALVRGYSEGPGDGEALAKTVQDYREGKTPPLRSSGGFEAGSAGGSSSGNGN